MLDEFVFDVCSLNLLMLTNTMSELRHSLLLSISLLLQCVRDGTFCDCTLVVGGVLSPASQCQFSGPSVLHTPTESALAFPCLMLHYGKHVTVIILPTDQTTYEDKEALADRC